MPKNFKTFQDVTVKDIQPFTVLVGANGSGKSTFFDVFGFLRDCLKDNVRPALARRGGFKEVVTRDHAEETIEIELKIRMPLRIGDKRSERTVTYLVEIGSTKGDVRVVREQLRYTRFGGGQPYNFLRFENGVGEAIRNEAELDRDPQSAERERKGSRRPIFSLSRALASFSVSKRRARSAISLKIGTFRISISVQREARRMSVSLNISLPPRRELAARRALSL